MLSTTENGQAPVGSSTSVRSRHFLENSVRWGPIIKKYRSLKEVPEETKSGQSGAGGGGGGGGEGGEQVGNSTTIPSKSRTTLRTDSMVPSK